MKVEDLMNLDCRKKESRNQLKEALQKLKPFEEKEVTINLIEKVINKITNKYDVMMQYIMISKMNDNLYYSASLKDGKGKWIYTVYGVKIEEIYAKACIKMFDMIAKKELHKKHEG